jgi:hypothetical protein
LTAACASSAAEKPTPPPEEGKRGGGGFGSDTPPSLALARIRDYEFTRVSSADVKGGNADYRTIAAGAELTLAEIDGPGAVTHLWITFTQKDARNDLWLRAWWDGEAQPSIDAPIGLFMGVAHRQGKIPFFTSAFFDVSPQFGLNCHLPMPYSKRARIAVVNRGDVKIDAFYYYVDAVKLRALPAETGYLHAAYREARPCVASQDFVFAEGAGRGHLLGVHLAVETTADGWWGEGDDKITLDGRPVGQGTGTEDYFGGAWNFRAEHAGLYEGSPRLEPETSGSRHFVYRFHALDPLPFSRSFRYAMEHGHANDRADHWASVAYWYQLPS